MRIRADNLTLRGLALALALLALAYVIRGYAVPMWVNKKIGAEDTAALSTDIAPRTALTPPLVMGIVRSGGRSIFDRADICDEICQILLYSRTADAVITAPSLNALPGETQRWKLEKREVPCTLPEHTGPGNDRWQGLPDVWQAMRDRALLGECIVRQAGRLQDAGLVIGHEIIGKGTSASADDLIIHPELSGGRISLWRFDKTGNAILLARETWREPRRLTPFLHKTMNGSAVSPALTLARLPEPSKISFRAGSFAVPRFLVLNVSRLNTASPADLRRALDRWLDHPELMDKGAGNELSARFTAIVKNGAEPGDIMRYERAIRDRRVYAHLINDALKSFPREMARFREAFFARVAQAAPDSNEIYGLDDILVDFPKGAFANPSPLMLSLIAHRQRAAHLKGLIMRISDGGATAAPLLFKFFEANIERKVEGPLRDVDENGPNNRIAFAALQGLCRLGPTISPAYNRIEAAAAPDPELHRELFESQQGAVIRVRLGRPIETIKPHGDDPKSWILNVRTSVAQSDCGD